MSRDNYDCGVPACEPNTSGITQLQDELGRRSKMVGVAIEQNKKINELKANLERVRNELAEAETYRQAYKLCEKAHSKKEAELAACREAKERYAKAIEKMGRDQQAFIKQAEKAERERDELRGLLSDFATWSEEATGVQLSSYDQDTTPYAVHVVLRAAVESAKQAEAALREGGE